MPAYLGRSMADISRSRWTSLLARLAIGGLVQTPKSMRLISPVTENPARVVPTESVVNPSSFFKGSSAALDATRPRRVMRDGAAGAILRRRVQSAVLPAAVTVVLVSSTRP